MANLTVSNWRERCKRARGGGVAMRELATLLTYLPVAFATSQCRTVESGADAALQRSLLGARACI
jgi:hypothetical protein